MPRHLFPQNLISRCLFRLPYKVQTGLVIGSAMMIHFSLGVVFTYGNMSPYLTSYLRKHSFPSLGPQIFNYVYVLQVGTQCLFSMTLGGFLEKYLGPGHTALLGGAIMSFGIFVSHWTIVESFYLLLLSYGFLFGLGLGISYNACIICVMKWLPNYKGLGTGLVLFGQGLGTLALNPMETKLINPENLAPDCHQMVGVDNIRYFCQASVLSAIPNVFLILSAITASIHVIGFLFSSIHRSEDVEELTEEEAEEDEKLQVSPKEALKSPTLYLLWATFFSHSLTVFMVIATYKTFGELFIFDDLFLSVVGSVSSIFTAGGRVFWGLMADKFGYQVSMSILSCCLSALMVTFYMTRMGGKALFLVWVSAIFFTFSGNNSIFPMAASKCFGPKYAGINYGLIISSVATGALVSATLSEVLVSVMGFKNMFLLCAVLDFIGFLLTALIQKTKHGRGYLHNRKDLSLRDDEAIIISGSDET